MGKTLYLGLDPGRYRNTDELVHLPLIETHPRPYEGEIKQFFENLDKATHIILTSRVAVTYFCHYGEKAQSNYTQKHFISIGKATENLLRSKGCRHVSSALLETAEGVVELLHTLPTPCHFFYPHSALSRPLILQQLQQKALPFTAIPLYDTVARSLKLPNLDCFDKIIFTSPSTVDAFFALTSQIPPFGKCVPIGPITEKALKSYYLGFTSQLTFDLFAAPN